MSITGIKYLFGALLGMTSLFAHAEQKEVPLFNTLAVIGEAEITCIQGDYPGYIEIEGSVDDITTIWTDSTLTLIVRDAEHRKKISLSTQGLSTVVLNGICEFNSYGVFGGESVSLSGISKSVFHFEDIKTDKLAISVVQGAMADIKRAECDEIGVTALNGSIATVDGIGALMVGAVAGIDSTVILSGECDKKGVVIIDNGVIDAKGLIEGKRIKEEQGRDGREINNKRRVNDSREEVTPVTIP